MGFWERAKPLIAESGLTRREVAERAELNVRTMEGLIHRNVEPRAEEAARLALVLGTTVEYLTLGRAPETKFDSRLQPRPALRSLVEVLFRIPDTELAPLQILATGLVERLSSSNQDVAAEPKLDFSANA